MESIQEEPGSKSENNYQAFVEEQESVVEDRESEECEECGDKSDNEADNEADNEISRLDYAQSPSRRCDYEKVCPVVYLRKEQVNPLLLRGFREYCEGFQYTNDCPVANMISNNPDWKSDLSSHAEGNSDSSLEIMTL